jgi:hypothetical protein
LVCSGEYDLGEQVLRRAIELDPNNPTMRALFDLVHNRERRPLPAVAAQ